MEQSIELNRVMRRPDGSLATEHAYGCIKDLVMGLQFRPGQHLCATRLSDWLDVSPTPVREALHRLSKESLIVNVPGRGFFCRVPTLKEVRDLNRVLEICLRDSILQYTSPERPKELELFPRGASTKLTQHVAGRVAVVRDAFHWLATLSGNIVLSLVANNMIDRTHFIRCVDLRSDAVFEIYDSLLRRAEEELAKPCAEEAAKHVQSLCSSVDERLPDLLKEAISYMYEPQAHSSARYSLQ